MIKTESREEQVLKMMEEHGRLTVNEVAKAFFISEPSARRLCKKLADEGKAIRIHGGIRRLEPNVSSFQYHYQQIEKENLEEKAMIARYAVSLIQPGSVVFLEAGTTIKQVAVQLAERISKEKLDVTIYTNSLQNLSVLSEVTKVNMTGGEFRPLRQDFSGYIAEKTIRVLWFDCCFIGADAINIRDGIMASDVDTVRFDELLIGRTKTSYVLAHSEKFYNRSLISIAPIDEVSGIITDNRMKPEVLQEYTSRGVNLICVDPERK